VLPPIVNSNSSAVKSFVIITSFFGKVVTPAIEYSTVFNPVPVLICKGCSTDIIFPIPELVIPN